MWESVLTRMHLVKLHPSLPCHRNPDFPQGVSLHAGQQTSKHGFLPMLLGLSFLCLTNYKVFFKLSQIISCNLIFSKSQTSLRVHKNTQAVSKTLERCQPQCSVYPCPGLWGRAISNVWQRFRTPAECRAALKHFCHELQSCEDCPQVIES